MHFDNLIEPIYSDFVKEMRRFAHLQEDKKLQAAFYWALKNNIEHISIKNVTSVEHAGNEDIGYLEHLEEKLGYEIGACINKNPKSFYKIEEKGYYGTTIRKEVFLIRINTNYSEKELSK